MTVIVSVETVVLALLALLVVALLRSHAEILRRLETLPAGGSRPQAPPAGPLDERAAADIAGVTPAGDARSFSLGGGGGGDTLLAFLSSGCSSCAALLEALERDGAPAGVGRLIVVTQDPSVERPVRFRAAAERVHVVMSSQAWQDYAVPGSPYFIQVSGSGTVVGEGSATSWERVESLIVDAGEDIGPAHDVRHAGRIDEALAAAGLAAGDPSLHPSRTWTPSR